MLELFDAELRKDSMLLRAVVKDAVLQVLEEEDDQGRCAQREAETTAGQFLPRLDRFCSPQPGGMPKRGS